MLRIPTVTTRLDRVAQYSRAPALDHRCPGVLGRPIKSGDDGLFRGCSAYPPSPPGLTGWPSIPGRPRSIIDAPAYWVARSSRAMTDFFGDAPHTHRHHPA